ncbi:hypothetical protein KR018_000145 [Drosophila ironensis]|nr:hypothetical protein KR018_000145 [Drosophila ironensis]
METPRASGRLSRTPTPRLSERKRQLFGSPVSRLQKIADDEDEDVDILGLTPLKQQASANRPLPSRSLFAHESEGSAGCSSSPETNKENKKGPRKAPTSNATDEQLPHLFTTTMRLNSRSSSSHNSSPRTPKTFRKRADSLMSSPSESGSPPDKANRKKATPQPHRRSPRTLKRQEARAEAEPTASSSTANQKKIKASETVTDNVQRGKTQAALGTPRRQVPKVLLGSKTPKSALGTPRRQAAKADLGGNTPKSAIGTPKRQASKVVVSESQTPRSTARKTQVEPGNKTPRSAIGTPRSRGSNTIKMTSNPVNAKPASSVGTKINNAELPLELPETDDEAAAEQGKKRVHVATTPPADNSPTQSPQSKMRKMNLESSIPTMAFYSHRNPGTIQTSPTTRTPKSSRKRGRGQSGTPKPRISPTSRPVLGINKGVRHKIRKKDLAARMPHSDLDNILNSLRNERLKNLITTKREERAKVEEVHQILRTARDPIKMAKPLSVIDAGDANNNNNNKEWQNMEGDFSDLSGDEENVPFEEMEPIIPLIRHEVVQVSPPAESVDLSKRKFFKSGRRSSTCMEVKITDNIRASVSHGKIALVQAPRRKPRGLRVKSRTLFSAEQATVDAILKNLDDTIVGEIVESEPMETDAKQITMEYLEPVIYSPVDPFAEYRQRLPYQTEDPQTIENQQILLEFLISNGICTEENFKIFIADPDNHKQEASKIVDDLYMVVNSEEAALLAEEKSLQQLPQTGEEEEVPPGEELAAAEPAQPKLFPIFTQRLQPVVQKSTRRRPGGSLGRLSEAAIGANQYQIDAGQKAFGARQCKQCGLVYTVHEPEEEKLHREYHDSVHVLRFKGWIDEDIVTVYPEWAPDGRIIRMNERAPAARLERLRDLIGVVDKELGYSSYIVPKVFVAFIAVRKQQIVGFCLVQPLSQAHRFIRVDGTDYFSEETFEASCGVSRIWVSPLQRRAGIATKLLRAVRLHTVLGQEIPVERIAFSTPTDDGRALARHITGLDNFLTYDQ